MGESSDSVSIDIDMVPFGGKVTKLPIKPLPILFIYIFLYLFNVFDNCICVVCAGICGEDQQRFSECVCVW